MPPPPPTRITSPGVYVEELPRGGPSISGVPTSIAALVGWSAQGPTDRAQRVRTFDDFVRRFGGLDRRSLLGYAVQQFFANGGEDAWVIRLVAEDAQTASMTLDGKLQITAASPGAWANAYRIETRLVAGDATRFDLTVIHQAPGQAPATVERFDTLSMQPADARFVADRINAESACIRVALIGAPTSPPADTAARPFTTAGRDGTPLAPNDAAFAARLMPPGREGGVHLLERVDRFNLLCVPGETTATTVTALQAFCFARRAFLIVDSPAGASAKAMASGPAPASSDPAAANAALYFPWIRAADPLDGNRLRAFPPCGFVAGIYARTDRTRGVWKAPAGTEAVVTGATGLEVVLPGDAAGPLNKVAVNCIRAMPTFGTVVWGSRTRLGSASAGLDWTYVPVRRLALFIEASIDEGLRWAVFEPNDEPLWAQIRLQADAFLNGLFRQGAFQGRSPAEAYFVKCDAGTTTQDDVQRGVVNALIGFAPLKPAEFVVVKISVHLGAP